MNFRSLRRHDPDQVLWVVALALPRRSTSQLPFGAPLGPLLRIMTAFAGAYKENIGGSFWIFRNLDQMIESQLLEALIPFCLAAHVEQFLRHYY